jgi:hypothetical protein
MATECARRGYDLFLTDISKTQLTKIGQGITRQYLVGCETFPADLTLKTDVDDLLKYIDDKNLRFDMLLNIAGIDHEGGFLDRKSEDLVDIVRINVEATIRITHELLQRRTPDFYLVFVSSLASQFPMPLKATYAASKRFLFDLALSLRQELKDQGVRVLVLCPGGLATTCSTIEAIDAQGFFGTVTTNRLELVSHRTLSKVLLGKSVYFPGFFNNFLRIMNGLLPRDLVIKIIYHRWLVSQKKWLRFQKTESRT